MKHLTEKRSFRRRLLSPPSSGRLCSLTGPARCSRVSTFFNKVGFAPRGEGWEAAAGVRGGDKLRVSPVGRPSVQKETVQRGGSKWMLRGHSQFSESDSARAACNAASSSML